ncbi:SDR family NAD(P)-dependent oxidoreductase, partial [Pararhodobacter aggregans]|uniref:SDR family NAD(P)-dependent oxidoreductase n=1 Tax=Pararhodobacter aggregans TaxID=404875 RepID=UPI003A922DB1
MSLPRTPSFRLEGRRALVTGASSGIGLACASALADAGAEVMMVARGADRLEEASAALRSAGGSIRARSLDIADTTALRAFVTVEGPFDILVNPPGMARHSAA